MKKLIICSAAALTLLFALNSCEGCVKSVTKKAAKVGISAVEGVVEAVDESGEKLAEKTTDAAGKVAEGMGRSLERQLDEHASKVASVAGKSTVQVVDGFLGGATTEISGFYDDIPHTENFPSGIALDFFAKYKTSPVVDAYFIIPENGKYLAKFECVDNQDKIFLTKEIKINKTSAEGNKKYTLTSFALNNEELQAFNDVKNVKITVTKEK